MVYSFCGIDDPIIDRIDFYDHGLLFYSLHYYEMEKKAFYLCLSDVVASKRVS